MSPKGHLINELKSEPFHSVIYIFNNKERREEGARKEGGRKGERVRADFSFSATLTK